MPATEFGARVRLEGGVAIVDLRGDIEAGAEEELAQAFARAAGARPQSVLLNFAEVPYINSTGIALIVGLLAQARKERLPIAACGLGEHYREIFEITRLVDFMQIFPDEKSAVGGATLETGGR
jgi:anti-anti-sigma factor